MHQHMEVDQQRLLENDHLLDNSSLLDRRASSSLYAYQMHTNTVDNA